MYTLSKISQDFWAILNEKGDAVVVAQTQEELAHLGYVSEPTTLKFTVIYSEPLSLRILRHNMKIAKKNEKKFNTARRERNDSVI